MQHTGNTMDSDGIDCEVFVNRKCTVFSVLQQAAMEFPEMIKEIIINNKKRDTY